MLMKYLIALIILAIPTYLIRFDIGGIPTTFLELLIYAVFLYSVIKIGFCQSIKANKNFLLPIGLLLLAVVISIFVALEKSVALGQFKAYFVDPLLVFYLMVCCLEKKDLPLLVVALSGSGLVVSGYSIYQKMIGNITSDGRVIGIFGYSPNYVALFLVPIIVMQIACSLQLFKAKRILLFVICNLSFVISLYALYLSGSRGGLLAVFGGLIFYCIVSIWSKIKTKIGLKIGLALLIIALITGAWLTFKPNFTVTSGRTSTSNNIRYQIWQTSWELAVDKPILGVGLGNFQNSFNDLTKNRVNYPEFITPLALTPHNVFLMFYLTTGLLGIVAFIWLLYIFFKWGFVNQKDITSRVLMAMMVALLLHGLVDASYFKNDLALLFWIIYGSMIISQER